MVDLSWCPLLLLRAEASLSDGQLHSVALRHLEAAVVGKEDFHFVFAGAQLRDAATRQRLLAIDESCTCARPLSCRHPNQQR